MVTVRVLFSTAIFLAAFSVPVAADTTFDCPRFYLKYDPDSGEMKCVSKPRNRRNNPSDIIQRQQRAVAAGLRAVRTLANNTFRTEDDEKRIRELLADIRVRIREIQARSRELQSEQRALSSGLVSAQKQRIAAQERLTDQLIAAQKALTEQLLAQQRQRMRSLIDDANKRTNDLTR